jgi:hypothetical protein
MNKTREDALKTGETLDKLVKGRNTPQKIVMRYALPNGPSTKKGPGYMKKGRELKPSSNSSRGLFTALSVVVSEPRTPHLF